MIDVTLPLVFDFVLFSAVFFAILVLPGYFFANLFFGRDEFDTFERIPVAFSFSIAYASTLGIILYLLNADATAFMILLFVTVPLLAVANGLLIRRQRRAHLVKRRDINPTPDEPGPTSARVNFAVYCLILVAFLLMLYRGAMFSWSVDSMDHVGTIRDIVEKRQLFPTNAFYADEAGLGADSRKGLYHTSLALLSIITRIEPYQIWIWLPALLLPILLCSYFSFAKEVFKNQNIALVSVVLFIICFEGINKDYLRTAGYPTIVAFQMYLITVFFLFKYLRNKRTAFLIGCAFLGYAIGTVHIYYFVQYCIALFAFFVFVCLFRWTNKQLMVNILKSSALTILVSIPFLILKYKLSYAIGHPSHLQLRHMLMFSDNVSVVNPVPLWNIVGPMGVFAFILTPFLYRYARKHDGILFLFANMVITPLIVFNPLAVSLLGKLVTTGLVRRIIRLAPYVSVLGFFSYKMICALFVEHDLRNKAKSLVFFAILIAISIPYVSQIHNDFTPSARVRERNQSAFMWIDALEFLEDEIEEPSVVLSDPWTSYSIPAFTKHYVLAVPFGHASPKDANNVGNIRDAMNVLSPYTDMKNTVDILNKHNVRYVVINETFKTTSHRHAWSINPRLYDQTRHKFEAHPDIFHKIYGEEELRIYEFVSRSNALDSLKIESTDRPFILDRKPNLQNEVNAVFEGQFMLLGAVTNRDTVSCGDTLGITCYWKNLEEETPLAYYRVYVRFDTEYDKGALYRPYWSKIYRIIRQRVEGERFRFRSDHNPVDGVYPPNNWRPGEIVVDEFQVIVPNDVSAGSYVIKIRLLETPFGPNYYLSDFLSDKDIYDGVEVGSIVIEQ